MNRRDIVLLALHHEQPPTCPYHIRLTRSAKDTLVRATGDRDIMDRLGNHINYMPCRSPQEETETRPGFVRDEFGVEWNRTLDRDVGVVEAVRVTPENLSSYPFPDPLAPGRFDFVKAGCAGPADHFRLATKRFTLFERAWSLRGMENLLVDFVASPDFAEALLDRITDFNLAIVDEALKFPIDGFHFGDDWGQQRGLIMGPAHWRRFIKPRMAKLFARVKAAGKFVSLHSCGDVRQILPDLIELGLDLFNPFQPEAMNVVELKQKFGGRLSFWGGISTQRTLPFGTPGQVKAEVNDRIRRLGKGGGYICAPAHDVPADVPAENILALIDALQNQA